MKRFKTNRLAIPLAALLLLAQAACTPKEVKIKQHDAPIETEEVVHAPRGEDANDSEFSGLDLKGTDNGGLQLQSGEGGLKALEALKPFVLNANYVENPKYNTTPKMRQMLSVWNRTLLESLKAQPSSPEGLKLLDETMKMILSGCDEELKGCVSIGVFKQDHSSARVVEESVRRIETEIATAPDDKSKSAAVRKYYRNLMLSFDLRNKVGDAQFEFLYLNRARDYAESFEDVPEAKRATLMQRHSAIFEMILNRFSPEKLDSSFRERFRKFVDNFQPWDYSRKKVNPFGVGATKMLELAAKNFLYDPKTGARSASLDEAITASQALPPVDPKRPIEDICAERKKEAFEVREKDQTNAREISFSEKLDTLRKCHRELVSNLKLADDFEKGEYFFVVDRLFHDHLNPDDASAIWQGSRRESQKLLPILEKYLKVQIAWMVLETNTYMSSIYAKKDGFTSQTLFVKAIEESYPISTKWNLLIGKINRISVFVNRHMKTAGPAGAEFDRVDKMLTSLGRNIKFLSVYPNMMMMAYFMEEVDFKLRVYTMWGPVEIDTETIVTMFFNGNLPPFFNFGNDSEGVMRLETLHAFYFALKTQAFTAFSGSDAKPVDEVKFFEKVVAKYLAEVRRELEESYRRTWSHFESQSGYQNFLLTCRQDREIIAKGGDPGKSGMKLLMELQSLLHNSYMSKHEQSPARAAFGFYQASVIEDIALIRDRLRPRLAFVESLVDVLDGHLESAGVSAAERTEKIAQIRRSIDAQTDMKTALLTEILKRHREISDCLTQTMNIEFDRQLKLVEKEESFLRKTYRLIQTARVPHNAPDHFDVLENWSSQNPIALPGETLPEGVRARDTISPNEYTSNTLDMLLRMRVYLNEIAPNVVVKLPPDLLNHPFWTNSRDSAIPGNVSEEEFVRLGLARFNSGFFSWQSSTADLNPLRIRLELLAELFRLGEVEIYDWRKPECAVSPVPKGCPKMKVRVGADELIRELRSTLRLVSLTENGKEKKEVGLLRKMGITNKFALRDLQMIFLNEKNQPVTFAEMLYNVLSTDNVAMNEAKEYYNTEKSVGHFLFTADCSVKNSMRLRYRPLAMGAFQVAEDFAKAVEAAEKADAETGNVLELGYEISGGDVLKILPAIAQDPKTGKKVPVYLSRQRIDDFETRKQIFHNDTQQFFLKNEACSDKLAKPGTTN